MSENTQHKIDRVRAPRVQITYDVLVGDTTEIKELPFVVGIMANLSGMHSDTVKIKDKKFIDIDADNFDDIMSFIQPALSLNASNKLFNNDSKLKADLRFESMDDFKPLSIVKQVPALLKLYESRIHLKDLLAKLDGNDVLEQLLNDIVHDPDKRESLLIELGLIKKSFMPSIRMKKETNDYQADQNNSDDELDPK
ncbi:MAG: type VI secretion system contractile sheath small subunit [Candidatus Paracaedibacteraceae bacterium]|nr:type VI secretion system contractile sheath small subunit [Candidatus Paracaedibacteraceae bacterium]